ncbi:signal peptidase II [Acidihalobacter aeolianus]|uniref:Lipoprotein signal peptidase n=1 Tax=Acidihalobacter aeolianus TaxID=2792603 RepID=A0A1D8K454_9GAMM|nr:signal peptidase II [Acidihalobacter aeolianus]AOV15745.1 signal peptidase II [Acidihalobacter aeolianus]
MNRRGLRWLWLAAIVIALDQASKWLALQALPYGRPVPILPGFNLTLVFNTGAAFSMLSGAGGWQRWLFIALAAVVALALVTWLLRLGPRERWVGAAVSLILGGALSNALDRVVRDHVIDYIDLYYKQWHWPVFNLADSAITVGAAILVVRTLFRR